jgi:spermidine synthase
MGITLPVLCRFYVEDLGHIGARTGRLYGINTIGGAAGAVLCGFLLIAGLGIWGALAVAVGIKVLIGILCIIVARSTNPHKPNLNVQHSTSTIQRTIKNKTPGY